jgi:HK97 family phage major capsid protein
MDIRSRRIITRGVIDMATSAILESDSYLYSGRVAECRDGDADLAAITRSITEIGDAAKAGNVKVTEQLKSIETNSSSMAARLLDLEQRILTRGIPARNTEGGAFDLCALVAGDAKLAALLKGDAQKITIPINRGLHTICKSILGNAGSTGVSPAFEYVGLPEIVQGGPRGFRGRRLQVLESITVIPVSMAESAVPKLENWNDESALQTHEGGLKGESTFNFENIIQRHATVATFANVSKQLLGDQPMLIEFLNRVMTYFVMRKLENLVVAGNGTTDQISGLLTQGIPFVSSELHSVDKIGSCITSLTALGYTPDLVILNPFDFFGIVSEKDANGRYIAAGFSAPAPNSLWGVHSVPSAALTSGTAVVLDSSQVALLDREQANILIGYQGSQFVENAATILAELRASLACFDSHAVNILSLPTDSP